MTAIYKREMKTYFTSPIAYVFLAISAFFSETFFISYSVILNESSDLNGVFNILPMVYLFLIPMLTMRLISEERKTKTDQILITSPVSITSIVVAKFLAASSVVGCGVGISLINVIVVAVYGSPAYGTMFTCYLGFLLFCLALVSIGIFISSVTESQVVAAVLTMGIFFALWTVNYVSIWVRNKVVVAVLAYISVINQMSDFMMGLINPAAILYFLSVVVIFIFLTVRVIDKRRWS